VAKRNKAQPWDAVFDGLRVVRSGSSVCAPPATDAELDAVESQLGSRLPQSYRQFMKRFGSGELLNWVWLKGIDPSQKGFLDISRHTRRIREFVAESEDSFPNVDWFAQLVYFGSNGGGDWYCWDPSAESRSHPREYPCYCLLHEDEGNAIPIGDTFWEFIAWGAPDYRSLQEHESDELPPVGGLTFYPRYIRDKKVPAKKHVKLWLAFNNTARDLALSIRDRGQTDAFPILADALQEAGCTNSDLLDSCRTGDPDIDGVWVLQVLLGKAK
jgi:hypothetical protein